jgi:hypothetical protein
MRTPIASCLLVATIFLAASPAARAQGPIKAVKAGVNFSHYRGPCPAHLRFTGNIYVDHYPMTYNYEWERSDGAKSQKHVVHVTGPAQLHIVVREEWVMGSPGTKEVWQQLRVRTGNTDVTSQPAKVVVDCH